MKGLFGMILTYTKFSRDANFTPVNQGKIVLCLVRNFTMSFHLMGKYVPSSNITLNT